MVRRYFHTPGWQRTGGTFCLEIVDYKGNGEQAGIKHLTDYTTKPLSDDFIEGTRRLGVTLMQRAEQAVERGNWSEICLLPYVHKDRDIERWGSW